MFRSPVPFKPPARATRPAAAVFLLVIPPTRMKKQRARGPILSTLARRAYRRPVTDKDVETLLSFYQAGRNTGNFEAGIENALRLILASPKFLFRSEPDPANQPAGSIYRVSDLELASRLSFFLWSSLPDDDLHQRRGARQIKRSGGARKTSPPYAGRSQGGSSGE